MLEKGMQQTWKMMPTWRQNGGRNQSKINKRTIQQKSMEIDANMKRPRAMDPKGREGALGPGVPGRGKEFLRRLQVKVSSCIQHPAKNKHPANNKKAKP